MKEDISKLLKLTFLIHFFVAVIFGLLFTVLFELYVDFVDWPYLADPVTGRILGAVFLGLAGGSLLAWRETRWERVKIVVQIEIVWLIIGTVVLFFAVFNFDLIYLFIIWLQIAILIFFLVAFVWFYYDQEWRK